MSVKNSLMSFWTIKTLPTTRPVVQNENLAGQHPHAPRQALCSGSPAGGKAYSWQSKNNAGDFLRCDLVVCAGLVENIRMQIKIWKTEAAERKAAVPRRPRDQGGLGTRLCRPLVSRCLFPWPLEQIRGASEGPPRWHFQCFPACLRDAAPAAEKMTSLRS